MTNRDRLHAVYKNRKLDQADCDKYTAFDPAYLFFRMQRQRSIIKLFKSYGIHSLRKRKILEIGCGNGSVLHEFITYGARSNDLYGIDILHHRMVKVCKRLPMVKFLCADGSCLPFSDEAFDIVTQFTALSSILDASIRKRIAGEMQRVLKPEGLIIWYDFIWNPRNAETCGINRREIQNCFPGCTFSFHRTTLMPPLARRLVPVSWPAAILVESIHLLNSHYLVGIQKVH